MDDDGYPTEDELKRIEEWTLRDGFEALGEYVCSLWYFSNWAEFRDWKKDEYGDEYRELRLATAGWSGNEEIVSALDRNRMFNALCWQSSHRGGLYIYHIPKLK
jgi:hypothetical protein